MGPPGMIPAPPFGSLDLPERRTYIAQREGLGMLPPYYTFPRGFAGRRVVHFADNTVAI